MQAISIDYHVRGQLLRCFTTYLLSVLAFLLLFLSPSLFAESIYGQISSEVSTQANGSISTKLFVTNNKDQRYLLDLSSLKKEQSTKDLLKLRLSTGSFARLSVKRISNRKISLKKIKRITRIAKASMPAPQHVRHKKVAVVLVESPGSKSAISEYQVTEYFRLINSQYSFTPVESLADLFSTSTNENLIFSLKKNVNLQLNPIKLYESVIIDLKKNEKCETDYRLWSDRAEEILKERGANLNNFDHILFIFPEQQFLGCSIVAQGELFGRYSWHFTANITAFAHELGHNLGLYHAGVANTSIEHAEYADHSCPMGALNPVLTSFNAPHVIQLGAAGGANGKRLLELKQPGRYEVKLHNLDATNTEDLPPEVTQIVRISLNDKQPPYILSYRPKIKVSVRNFLFGASIHRDFGLAMPTVLLKVLSNGSFLYDLKHGVKITQISKKIDEVDLLIEIQPDNQFSTYLKIKEPLTPLNIGQDCISYDPCRLSDQQKIGATLHCNDTPVDEKLKALIMQMDLPICEDTKDLTKDDGFFPDAFTFQADSDGDGVFDTQDCAPFDPKRWQDSFYFDHDLDGIPTFDYSPSVTHYPRLCLGDDLPPGFISASNVLFFDDCPYLYNPEQSGSNRSLTNLNPVCKISAKKPSNLNLKMIYLEQAIKLVSKNQLKIKESETLAILLAKLRSNRRMDRAALKLPQTKFEKQIKSALDEYKSTGKFDLTKIYSWLVQELDRSV
jgi:hypothetical protein